MKLLSAPRFYSDDAAPSWLLSLVLFAPPVAVSNLHAAGFELEFKRYSDNVTPVIDCNRGGAEIGCSGGPSIGDKSPILLEYVTINGVQYQHQIIGDPTTGWVQEVYIDRFNSGVCGDISCYNGNPLGVAENAAAFPTMTVVRQRMTSTEGGATYTSEFLKDQLLNKARITSAMVSDRMSYYFESDARSLDFAAANIANTAPVIMTFSLLGADAVIPPRITAIGAPIGGDFDFSTDVNNSIVEAGQVSFDEATGQYSYFDSASSFNVGQNWVSFFDLAQNIDCDSDRPECP